MVPGAGVEPAQCFHRGIFLPTTALAATGITPVFVVWTFSLPYYCIHNLGRSRQVSTLSSIRMLHEVTQILRAGTHQCSFNFYINAPNTDKSECRAIWWKLRRTEKSD